MNETLKSRTRKVVPRHEKQYLLPRVRRVIALPDCVNHSLLTSRPKPRMESKMSDRAVHTAQRSSGSRTAF